LIIALDNFIQLSSTARPHPLSASGKPPLLDVITNSVVANPSKATIP